MTPVDKNHFPPVLFMIGFDHSRRAPGFSINWGRKSHAMAGERVYRHRFGFFFHVDCWVERS